MHWFWRAAIAAFIANLSCMLLATRIFAWLQFKVDWGDWEIGPTAMGAVLIALAFPLTVISLAVFTLLRPREWDYETRCRKCGYILRGITEPRCPECGEKI